MCFRSIKVLRDSYGKPYVELSDQAAEQAEKLGACFIHISLSDERDFGNSYATATSIFKVVCFRPMTIG